jgi:glycine oxidase
MRKDVIVIGGGVIGCSIALRLAQTGLKVAVIERGRIGCEASRAAAGMLAPQSEARSAGPFFESCMRSRSMWRDFAAELKEVSGIDVEYRDEGMLCISVAGEDDQALYEWSSWQGEAGLAVEALTPREARGLEPEVTERASGAVFIPGDHQVENRLLMDALGVALLRAGVEVVEGREVNGLVVERGKVTGVAAGGCIIGAGAVVVAAGSWSTRLLEPIGPSVEVVPARGQMVAVRSGSTVGRILHSSKC